MSVAALLDLFRRNPTGMSPDRLRARLRSRAKWFLTFSKDTPPARLDVLVTHGEGCLVDLMAPLDARDPTAHPEIGSYHFACDLDASEKLRELATAAIAETRQRPVIPHPPGTLAMSVGLGRRDLDDPTARASMPLLQSPPEPVAQFLAAVDALVKESLAHRLMTIRALATLAPAPPGRLAVTVTLANSGLIPAAFRNPAGNHPLGVIVLLSGAPDGPTLLPSDTTDIRSASTERTVALAPGASATFTSSVRLPDTLRPGAHEVSVRMKLGDLDAEGALVRGELFVRAGTLDVPRDTQRKDERRS